MRVGAKQVVAALDATIEDRRGHVGLRTRSHVVRVG